MLSPDEEHKEWFAYGTQNAVWDDVKLVQDSSDHYSLSKRTGKDYAWIGMLHGCRAKGLCYAGGENGGVALGLRYFFEKYPSALEITGLAGSRPKMTVWLWPRTAKRWICGIIQETPTWPARMKALMKCALIRQALRTQMKSAWRAFRTCRLTKSLMHSLTNGRRRRLLYASRTSITNQKHSGSGASLTHPIRLKRAGRTARRCLSVL